MQKLVIVSTALWLPLLSLAQGSLKYDPPKGWVSKPPASAMRVAEFVLPRAMGDPEDASLTIYFFGGQGGSVEANLVRWTNQMVQPDGRPSRQVAKTERFSSNGMKVTVLDVSGAYTAEMRPGASERYNKSNFRMKAAVLETSAGPYFFKLIGPQKTVARWDESFATFIKSVRTQ